MSEKLWDSRLLRLTAILALGTAAAFATGERLRVLSLLLAAGASIVTAVLCRRAPAPGRAARRFWSANAAAQVLFALTLLTKFLPVVSQVAHVAAVLLVVGAAVLLPMRSITRTEVITLCLDLSTVLAAGGLFLWHLVGLPLSRGTATAAELGPTIGYLVGGMVGISVVMKLTTGRGDTLTRGALRFIGASALIGGLGTALTSAFDRWPDLDPTVLISAFGALVVAVAARYQAVEPVELVGRRRHHTLYPYLAVAAVGALMISTIVADSGDELSIAVGSLVLTVLVGARQVLAIRENDRLVERTQRDEERFRLLVQNSTEVVTITGPDAAVRYISPSVTRVLGLDPADVVGRPLAGFVHPDDLSIVGDAYATMLSAHGASATMHARFRHADGSWRWLETIGANLTHEPSVGGVVTNGRDITETRTVQDRLSHDATHDTLTGLANRALFAERIAADLRTGKNFSLVLIDLDDFKTVNDTLGHHVGDGLLVAVAERMRASVRPVDLVARLGGDEFAILFDEMSGEPVDRALRRIAEQLLIPVEVDGQLLSVRASFGVTEGTAGDDAGDLLRHADIAMYEAKARGDGGQQRYVAGMESRSAERTRRDAELRRALADEQFVLHYQPVVALPGGDLAGVEALVRWQHPERGLLAPGEFIAAAEDTGLIVPLGRWVLRAAVRQAAAWRAGLGAGAPRTVSVNASPQQLQNPEFAAEVAAALDEAGLPPTCLTLEITESTALGGGATWTTLAALRELGVRVALDDFGTGASTLSLLVDCPVDQVKLDRSFVPGPGRDAIARAVLQLTQAMGVEAVAEGVETAEQAELLTAMGYRRAQGYHFARPAPAEDLFAHRVG
ncbi:EAL domain-containing protein [Actinoplanes bogorensis]|uniref:EAL domain-containing protein n=1 Tax=Paractinoplanes bogorensis TaxID=1610840 RepID=A0ABS5YJL1_9ACTN|nr:EAL domain-containing protein [Actinoplanes bogorensis]MBU2663657.1 EAL domain-containing protein [Actinoplanes bogorensis]